MPDPAPDTIEAFISRWQGQEGGQERANFPLFLTEFCAALALPPQLALPATSPPRMAIASPSVAPPDVTGAPRRA